MLEIIAPEVGVVLIGHDEWMDVIDVGRNEITNDAREGDKVLQTYFL